MSLSPSKILGGGGSIPTMSTDLVGIARLSTQRSNSIDLVDNVRGKSIGLVNSIDLVDKAVGT